MKRRNERSKPALSPGPVLSVIVPVRNTVSEFQQCLRALSFCRDDHIELIVVDDCSTEDIRSIAEQHGVRYFRLPQWSGPAAARNLGVRNAVGEIIVFVDADVLVVPSTLRTIREEFERDPDLAALFGSYDDAPACLDFWSSFKNLMHYSVHQSSLPEATTFWAGCGAIRKKAFADVGGFDAVRYPEASIEDIDLGIRLAQRGEKIRLAKHLQVKHLKKWTLKSLIYSDIKQRSIPWTQLILRSNYLPRDLNLSWASRVSALLVAVIVVLAAGMTRFLIGPSDWSPSTVVFMFLCVITALLTLNRKLYRVFVEKRGMAFALSAVLFHWVYLFYSGTVFILCSALTLLHGVFRSEASKSDVGTSLT
jgi:glycosyltransferase involved in cell wall biosynthesis